MDPITINLMPDGIQMPPIYFHTASAYFPQRTMVYPEGSSDFHQILLVLSGKGILHCNETDFPLERGCAFYTAAGFPCVYENTGNLVTAFLTAKGTAIAQLLSHYGCENFLFYDHIHVDDCLSGIQAIIKEYYAHKREGKLSAMTYSFFIDFFEQQKTPVMPLAQTCLYIERHFAGKLTLEQLASINQCSVSKLCHDFKAAYGCSIFQYLLNLRLNYARSFLRSTRDIRTKDAALSCGFDDISYFCKAYKRKFGKSPAQDQKSYFDPAGRRASE